MDPIDTLILIGAAVAVGGFVLWKLKRQTYHLRTVDPGKLYRDGIRSVRKWTNTLNRVRPRTIVCLFDDDELADTKRPYLKQGHDLARARGINVERVVVPKGDWPSQSAVRQFLSLVRQPENQPVLVHCQQGVHRTGMLVAAYQMTVLGWSKQRAVAAIHRFGRDWDGETMTDLRHFIDAYDPATMSLRDAQAKRVDDWDADQVKSSTTTST